MKYRQLKLEDIERYKEDIHSCYMTNHLVFDSQNPLREGMSIENTKWFVETFINSSDAVIVGIFDSEEKYLYGLVIFDNIRFANKSSAQVHIVNDKSIFGKKVRGLYEDILSTCMFDTLYAEIPSMAVHAIAMCKRLGFKKTGYIPDVLPYVNCSGEEKMYDIQIWTWRRCNEIPEKEDYCRRSHPKGCNSSVERRFEWLNSRERKLLSTKLERSTDLGAD